MVGLACACGDVDGYRTRQELSSGFCEFKVKSIYLQDDVKKQIGAFCSACSVLGNTTPGILGCSRDHDYVTSVLLLDACSQAARAVARSHLLVQEGASGLCVEVPNYFFSA